MFNLLRICSQSDPRTSDVVRVNVGPNCGQLL